ncbi:MAG: hypothetical protein WA741_07485 [Candidatus Sulfotelmatobacter sp.]
MEERRGESGEVESSEVESGQVESREVEERRFSAASEGGGGWALARWMVFDATIEYDHSG